MILVGKSGGKRPLKGRRRGWEGITKIDLREVGWGGVDWIDPAQNKYHWRAILNRVINLRVP
jgi:hypothetical protein